MGNKFAIGKRAIGLCDRCGGQYKLRKLREIVVRTKPTNILVCPDCWESDHPQLMLGTFVVEDAQALRRPRPDGSFTTVHTGSRDFQWGWMPVGGGDHNFTPNLLAPAGQVGSVTVVVT